MTLKYAAGNIKNQIDLSVTYGVSLLFSSSDCDETCIVTGKLTRLISDAVVDIVSLVDSGIIRDLPSYMNNALQRIRFL